MEFLKTLESIRTPLGEWIFYILTYGGEELVVLGLIGILYWCVDKKLAYRMAISYLLSALVINTIKISARIERPWIRDKSFTAVERAKRSATGYSFPSGHTQTAVSMYGTLGFRLRKLWISILLVILTGLVMMSRMYLGVHTPADVLVSFAVTTVIMIAVNVIADRIRMTSGLRLIMTCLFVAAGLFYLTYTLLLMHSGKLSYSDAADGCKGVGAGIGFAISWYIESEYIHFDTKCKNIWMQLLKAVIGVAGVMLIRIGIKSAFGTGIVVDMVRYMLMIGWAMLAMPVLIRRYFQYEKNDTMLHL